MLKEKNPFGVTRTNFSDSLCGYRSPMSSKDYKNTLLLPKTDFPMRAELPKREPAFLAKWREEKIYDQIMAARAERIPRRRLSSTTARPSPTATPTWATRSTWC